MAYPDTVKNRARQLRSEKGLTAWEIIQKLDTEFPKLERLPDEKTVRRWLTNPTKNKREDNVETPNAISIAKHAAPTPGENGEWKHRRYPHVLEYLGDVLSTEWTIDDLGRLGVPEGKAHSLLTSYGSCCDRAELVFNRLEDDRFFLILCFQVKLYRDYPGISTGHVETYSRIFGTNLDSRRRLRLVKRFLSHHTTETKQSNGLTQRLKGLFS